jgi:uroporphyrinogen decarboxylase
VDDAPGGRYLPEYMALREKYSFFERCQIPELACEITMQPVDIIGVDAAILFSDILVVPRQWDWKLTGLNQGDPFSEPIKLSVIL